LSQQKPVKSPTVAQPPKTDNVPKAKSPMSYGQGVAIILLLLVAMGLPIFRFLKPIEQWEYRIESPSDILFDKEMKALGDDGWELVFARRASAGDEYSHKVQYEMILKRPKR
jgi:hypothetical protein